MYRNAAPNTENMTTDTPTVTATYAETSPMDSRTAIPNIFNNFSERRTNINGDRQATSAGTIAEAAQEGSAVTFSKYLTKANQADLFINAIRTTH